MQFYSIDTGIQYHTNCEKNGTEVEIWSNKILISFDLAHDKNLQTDRHTNIGPKLFKTYLG